MEPLRLESFVNHICAVLKIHPVEISRSKNLTGNAIPIAYFGVTNFFIPSTV